MHLDGVLGSSPLWDTVSPAFSTVKMEWVAGLGDEEAERLVREDLRALVARYAEDPIRGVLDRPPARSRWSARASRRAHLPNGCGKDTRNLKKHPKVYSRLPTVADMSFKKT